MRQSDIRILMRHGIVGHSGRDSHHERSYNLKEKIEREGFYDLVRMGRSGMDGDIPKA
jgi:hypothetical protein